MARFLLDTNACIEVLRGRNPIFVQRFREHQGEQPAICTVVWAELLVGARLSPDPATARRRLDVFAELPCPGFSRAAAEHYAEIRALLQRQGQLIGPNDLFIASIALAHNLILVTHNTREFSRVPGLALEDWEM